MQKSISGIEAQKLMLARRSFTKQLISRFLFIKIVSVFAFVPHIEQFH